LSADLTVFQNIVDMGCEDQNAIPKYTGDLIYDGPDFDCENLPEFSVATCTNLNNVLNEMFLAICAIGATNNLQGINLGGAPGEVFIQRNGLLFEYRTLVGTNGNVVTINGNTIEIAAPAGGGGDITNAINLGIGAGVFAQKNGANLEFKSLTGGAGISITPSATEINIALTASFVTGGLNVGTGQGPFKQNAAGILEFYSLLPAGGPLPATPGIDLLLSGDDIQIWNVRRHVSFTTFAGQLDITNPTLVPGLTYTAVEEGGFTIHVDAEFLLDPNVIGQVAILKNGAPYALSNRRVQNGPNSTARRTTHTMWFDILGIGDTITVQGTQAGAAGLCEIDVAAMIIERTQ